MGKKKPESKKKAKKKEDDMEGHYEYDVECSYRKKCYFIGPDYCPTCRHNKANKGNWYKMPGM